MEDIIEGLQTIALGKTNIKWFSLYKTKFDYRLCFISQVTSLT